MCICGLRLLFAVRDCSFVCCSCLRLVFAFAVSCLCLWLQFVIAFCVCGLLLAIAVCDCGLLFVIAVLFAVCGCVCCLQSLSAICEYGFQFSSVCLPDRELYGIPWAPVDIHGIPSHFMECQEIPGDFQGITMGFY